MYRLYAQYVVFISQHLNEMVPSVSALAFKALLLPFLIGLSFVKNMRFMALTSIGANFLLLYACIVIFGTVWSGFVCLCLCLCLCGCFFLLFLN
jgi:hypothetical protein